MQTTEPRRRPVRATDAPTAGEPPRLPIAVHRLRALDRRGKAAAALIAGTLLLLPLAAVVHYVPDWVPASDGAFIGLRAYDVGTSRTPLTGQPSFSMVYQDTDAAVDHPGPLHFYILAPFVRLLGATAGLVLVTALTAGAAALISIWVVFRLLGRRAAVIAAVVMALVMFTNGAWAMASPISSVYACYPVFCAAVLMWALLCGDDRLLPLAVGCASLAAQTHLAVGPITAVIVAGMVAGTVLTWRRAGVQRDAAMRRRGVRLGTASLGLGVVLWAPVIVQQLFGRHPNLTALYEYSRDRDVETAGPESGLHQVINVLGWPPLLGETQMRGADGYLVGRPDGIAWVTAAGTVTALVGAAVVWRRRPAWAGLPGPGRRRALLVVAAAIVGVAGYLNGSRVPLGTEQFKLAFYHWVWPLSFLVVTALVLFVADVATTAVRAGAASRRGADEKNRVVPRWLPAGVVVTAAALIAVLAVADVTIDRPSNSLAALQTTEDGPAYEGLARQIAAQRDRFDGPTYLVTRNQLLRGEHHAALALQLEERGVPVTHPRNRIALVADDRLVDTDATASALVLVLHLLPRDPAGAADVPGRRIASVDNEAGFDTANYGDLVDELREGPAPRFDVPRWLLDHAEELGMSAGEVEAFMTTTYAGPWRDASIPRSLVDLARIDELIANPPTDRALDMDALRRLREDVVEAKGSGATCFAMDVYLVTGDELDEMLHRGAYAEDGS